VQDKTQSGKDKKRNLTLRLDANLIRKARVLAAQRGASISRLLSKQIELLVRDEDRYNVAKRKSLEWIRQGFHLGGKITATRDEWHER